MNGLFGVFRDLTVSWDDLFHDPAHIGYWEEPILFFIIVVVVAAATDARALGDIGICIYNVVVVIIIVVDVGRRNCGVVIVVVVVVATDIGTRAFWADSKGGSIWPNWRPLIIVDAVRLSLHR